MKLRFVVSTALLATAGCGFTPPPAPVVPPLPKGPVSAPPAPKLAADDVPALQRIAARSVYMKAQADLAATHSDDGLVKTFAAQLAQDYDKVHTAAQKIAASSNLSLDEGASAGEKARLATLGRLYGRSFNQAFLSDLTHASSTTERAQLARLQKNGSTADVKSLASADMALLERCRVQGIGLSHR